MELKRTAICIGLILSPLIAHARYTTQPVVKKDVPIEYMYYTALDSVTYETISSNAIERENSDEVLLNNLTVDVISRDKSSATLLVTNNTMRKFSDINISLGRTGFTLDTPLDQFTQIVVKVEDIIFDSAEDVEFLDPNPLFQPNANRYHESVSDHHIQAFYGLQNGLKVQYGQAETYDQYMDAFTNVFDQTRRDSWSKWHRTVTYKVPKEYRAHNKRGTSGGSWHAIGKKYLDRVMEFPEYTSMYGTLSHENAHSMGFKHGSGMAYGWDDFARKLATKHIEMGLYKNAEIIPQTNNFFWDYNPTSKTIRLFKKQNAEFNGFERIDFMYDTNKVRMDTVTSSFDQLTLPVVTNDENSAIVLNAKLKGHPTAVNLLIYGNEIDVAQTEEEFINSNDPTFEGYELDEHMHQEKRDQLAYEFAESSQWVDAFDAVDHELVKFTYKGEEETLCKFNHITQGLEPLTLLGLVKGDVCLVGENNSYKGELNYSSKPNAYQVVSLDNESVENGKLKVFVTRQKRLAEVCFYADPSLTALHGVGFKSESGKCNSYMTAFNGRGWGMSKNFHTINIDTSDPNELPKHLGWVTNEDVLTPVAIEIDGKDRNVCRFMVDAGIQEFGFVNDENKCSIGSTNSINGIQGLSSSDYEVADSLLGEPDTPVTVKYNDGVYELCYVTGKGSDGVSVKIGSRCGEIASTKSGKKASNGNTWVYRKHAIAAF